MSERAVLTRLGTEELARRLCGDTVPDPEALARAFQEAWLEHVRTHPRRLRPCVNCGTPSPNRWCSAGCFTAENGPMEDASDYEEEEPDAEE